MVAFRFCLGEQWPSGLWGFSRRRRQSVSLSLHDIYITTLTCPSRILRARIIPILLLPLFAL